MQRAVTMLLTIALQCSAALAWAAAPAETIPRMANGKPDLSGHWSNPYTPDMAAQGRVLDPLTRKPLAVHRRSPCPMPKPPPRAARRARWTCRIRNGACKHWKSYDPVNDGDYAGSCLPFGMSRNINSPHGVQFAAEPRRHSR